jgi:uncharacterized protein (DUF1330 family)
MKTYTDFILDITAQADLLQELNLVLPFPEAEQMRSWFASKGYHLESFDIEMLYQNQNALLDANEQVNY